MLRLSSAVCAIRGVCELGKTVPFDLRKFSSVGICSRSDGTFGLSRKKWTLSNTMLTTCCTPWPRWQLVTGGGWAAAGAAVVNVATAAAAPATSAAVASPAVARRRIGMVRSPTRQSTVAGHAIPDQGKVDRVRSNRPPSFLPLTAASITCPPTSWGECGLYKVAVDKAGNESATVTVNF